MSLDSWALEMPNKHERWILAKIKSVESGAATDEDRELFFRMVTELACKPLRRHARKEAGLPAFEKKHRRCVHPNGVHPRLAFLQPGEPEWHEHQRRLEQAEGIFQRLRLELECGN